VLCLIILALLAMVNLRGVRATGAVFLLPRLPFIGTLLVLVVVGVWRTTQSGGNPVPVVAPPPALPATTQLVTWWLLAKVFASGYQSILSKLAAAVFGRGCFIS